MVCLIYILSCNACCTKVLGYCDRRPQTVWLSQQIIYLFIYLLTVLKAVSPKIKVLAELIPLQGESLILVCRWPPSPSVSHGLSSLSVCVLMSFSHKDTDYIALGLRPINSFNLNYLYKETVSKFTHIWR